MAHQVKWTKTIFDTFAEEAMLSEEEKLILKTRIEGWTITKQSIELGKSESAINAMIKNLKLKYDQAQANRPDVLPIRKQ